MEYRVSNIQLAPGYTSEDLRSAAARKLGIARTSITDIQILRKGVDARKKAHVHYVISCACKVAPSVSLKRAQVYAPDTYQFPYAALKSPKRPLVVGTGPAGIFGAYCLALAGLKPVVIERGAAVEKRSQIVDTFFETAVFSPVTNVQFGEGGAGTFSDGKLNTGNNDVRQRFVLDTYVAAGAPPDILYLAKPHMGTDNIRVVAQRMRQQLQGLGCSFAFETQLIGLDVQNGAVCGAILQNSAKTWTEETNHIVLAVGNGARDTFRMLQLCNVELEPKNFAVGVRIEHLQTAIDMAQYGSRADFDNLPAADYKVTYHAQNGRPVYSFCVCPGGDVVAAASEAGGVVTNGMSMCARAGTNCNGALIVGVTPQDFPSEDVLAGVDFQRMLEEAAYARGGGEFTAPIQLVGDFLANRPSSRLGRVQPTYRPNTRFADLATILPSYVTKALREAIPAFARKISGFDAQDAVLTAVETRTSSPVRIVRDATTGLSNVRGLYPCGEGAGYAGGIMSAAVDGIRCAEKVCESLS